MDTGLGEYLDLSLSLPPPAIDIPDTSADDTAKSMGMVQDQTEQSTALR